MAAERDSVEALVASCILHLVIVVAMVFGVSLRGEEAVPIAGNIVEAHVVDQFDVEPLPLPPLEVDDARTAVEPQQEPDDAARRAAEEAARQTITG
ncbi:MAG: hypothetical protein AAF420_16430 [Pseudomonadota bacterium]